MQTIGDYAFYECSALESVEISDGLQSIGERAFDGCCALKSIVIPESVTDVGSFAFDGWTKEQTIYVAAEEKPAGWDVNWYDYSDAAVVWGYKG